MYLGMDAVLTLLACIDDGERGGSLLASKGGLE